MILLTEQHRADLLRSMFFLNDVQIHDREYALRLLRDADASNTRLRNEKHWAYSWGHAQTIRMLLRNEEHRLSRGRLVKMWTWIRCFYTSQMRFGILTHRWIAEAHPFLWFMVVVNLVLLAIIGAMLFLAGK